MTKLPAGALSKVPEVTIGFWVIKVHNERDRSWAPRVIIWASIFGVFTANYAQQSGN